MVLRLMLFFISLYIHSSLLLLHLIILFTHLFVYVFDSSSIIYCISIYAWFILVSAFICTSSLVKTTHSSLHCSHFYFFFVIIFVVSLLFLSFFYLFSFISICTLIFMYHLYPFFINYSIHPLFSIVYRVFVLLVYFIRKYSHQ